MTYSSDHQLDTVCLRRLGLVDVAASTLIAICAVELLDVSGERVVSIRIEASEIRLTVGLLASARARGLLTGLLSQDRFAGWQVSPAACA